jgi:hypothetical protein
MNIIRDGCVQVVPGIIEATWRRKKKRGSSSPLSSVGMLAIFIHLSTIAIEIEFIVECLQADP